MLKFRTTYPGVFAAASAILIALFGYVVLTVGPAAAALTSDQVTLRVLFLAVAVLIMPDVLDGVAIARAREPKRWVHTAMFIFYFGWFWATLMILMNWDGQTPPIQVLATWGPAGLLFGGLMVWLDKRDPDVLAARYDLEKPMTAHSLGWLYYAWPIIVTALIVALFAAPVGKPFDEAYLLFQLVFVGAIMPLYHYRPGRFWTNFWPRALGIALLVYGVTDLS